MENEMECTPPELREAAESVTMNMLLVKSKDRYEKTYRAYRDWCNDKGVPNIGSENVILAYFAQLKKDKKPSTLWAHYSMLRATLNIKDNIDISKNAKLIAFLKQQNIGYQPKKSSVFTKENMEKFLKNAPLEFLPHKV